MSRIYVALSEEENLRLDELKLQWEQTIGCSISRQQFVRMLLKKELGLEADG